MRIDVVGHLAGIGHHGPCMAHLLGIQQQTAIGEDLDAGVFQYLKDSLLFDPGMDVPAGKNRNFYTFMDLLSLYQSSKFLEFRK